MKIVWSYTFVLIVVVFCNTGSSNNEPSRGTWAPWAECDGIQCQEGSRFRKQNQLQNDIQLKDRECGSARDCEELRLKGYFRSGEYNIKLTSDTDLKVICDMSKQPAWTIFEHNFPNRTEVIDAPNHPDGLTYEVSYRIDVQQIVEFLEKRTCSQFLRYDCHHAVLTHQGEMLTYWLDRHHNKVNYWPGGESNAYGCACGVDKSCAGGAGHFCECESNDEVWRHDEGTIRQNHLLPVTGLYFTDTDAPHEMGFFTLGPLICY